MVNYLYMDTLIKNAFLKLSSYIYFDKQNLQIRERLANFVKQGKHQTLENIYQAILAMDKPIVDMIANDIHLLVLPKSVKENREKIDSKYIDQNFYTNQIYIEPALVERASVYIDMPIELHLITVLWVLKFGHILDSDLDTSCIANRLVLDDTGNVQKGRMLFFKYEKQYQKWWSNGIQAAKELFDKKEDVTILNFDIKNFFYSIKFDFSQVETRLSEQNVSSDPLHKLFVEIHKVYSTKLKGMAECIGLGETEKYPLPIGCVSSYVLANWYLKDFDFTFKENINPIYYSRYVDDLMVVIKDTVVKRVEPGELKEEGEEKGNPLVRYYINKHFSKVFGYEEIKKNETKDCYYYINVEKFKHLRLQPDKFNIYQFNANFSPHILNKFVEEQRERLSAFQFLSEDDDDSFKNLDEITFENNFDSADKGRRFKNLDDNKYKLSVYFAKLIRGTVVSGSTYCNEEVQKVKKFFKGYFLIKNYYFWEKLLTLFVIRREYNFTLGLYLQIQKQIELLNIALKTQTDFEIFDSDACLQSIKAFLFRYLDNALRMALGLYPNIIKETLPNPLKTIIKDLDDIKLFRNAYLLRKAGIAYPLIQFSNISQVDDYALFDLSEIRTLSDTYRNDNPDIYNIKYEPSLSVFFPYRIKFYECCLLIFKKTLHGYNDSYDLNKRREIKQYFDSLKYLDEAFDLFYAANYIELYNTDKSQYKEAFFQFSKISEKDIYGKGINQDHINSRHNLHCIAIPNSKPNNSLRLALVNKYVKEKDLEKSLLGFPNESSQRFEEFNQILDSIKKVKDVDFFIMPELSLPHGFVYHYVRQSVYNQIGFITGVEHIRIGNLGFNFLATCLPISLKGDSDAIVLFRLKNHYSHEEENWLHENRMVVPKPEHYYYDLIHWRNTYFSSYYCFEIADIKHRTLAYGLADVIFVPVFNLDIHYYNSLAESSSRDMHCFVVVCNTSQYGDSRVLVPSDHIHRDLIRVKGGTVNEYKSTLLVTDMNIALLRDFQTHFYHDATNFNDVHGTHFKPLPPDYPYQLAELRKKNKLFER
jgi:hypothetical protein